MSEQIRSWLSSQREPMLELLERVVNIDSGSYDKAGVDAVGEAFEDFFVSHGIEVPADHVAAGLVTVTREGSGAAFDWRQVTNGLFRVRSVRSDARPAGAHVAVVYKGYWFYVDETDQDTKSTFSLLVELSRLELAGKTGPGPVLTLPVSGR